jgi:hypothetical protein
MRPLSPADASFKRRNSLITRQMIRTLRGANGTGLDLTLLKKLTSGSNSLGIVAKNDRTRQVSRLGSPRIHETLPSCLDLCGGLFPRSFRELSRPLRLLLRLFRHWLGSYLLPQAPRPTRAQVAELAIVESLLVQANMKLRQPNPADPSHNQFATGAGLRIPVD